MWQLTPWGFELTHLGAWLRSQDGQQHNELQQEKRSWLTRFNNDHCKKPMAPSRNCQAKSDARRKAFCNTSQPISSSSRRARICHAKLAEAVARRLCISFQSNTINAKRISSRALCPATLDVHSTKLCEKSRSKQTDNCINICVLLILSLYLRQFLPNRPAGA